MSPPPPPPPPGASDAAGVELQKKDDATTATATATTTTTTTVATTPTTTATTTTTTPSPAPQQYDFRSMLAVYYANLFPFSHMHRWLSYGNLADKHTWRHREFSFTLSSGGDDVYIRYRSFDSVDDFRRELLEKCPHKIDIGAVFSSPPRDRAAGMVPREKEIVFDIDIDAYDGVRACCSGAAYCARCWPYMSVAVRVLSALLHDDFGFEHVAWFYSGRRGIHCWIADARARRMTDEGRTSVARYMSVLGDKGALVLQHPLHPSLRRVYDAYLVPFFERTILPAQRLLTTPATRATVLSMLRNAELARALEARWEKEPRTFADDDMACWRSLCASWQKEQQHSGSGSGSGGGGASASASASSPAAAVAAALGSASSSSFDPIAEIVFTYSYPRLDVNVSCQLNHLLKSPFCVHPKTGKVCVPIDAAAPEDFEPDRVPTVASLLAELNAQPGVALADKTTALTPLLKKFKRDFIEPLERENRSVKKRQASTSAAALEF